MQSDTRTANDNLTWGIEAQENNGTVKYIFWNIAHDPNHLDGPGFIHLYVVKKFSSEGGTWGERCRKTWVGTLAIALQLPICRGARLENEWCCRSDHQTDGRR